MAQFYVIETIENCIFCYVALFFKTQFSQGERDEVSDDLCILASVYEVIIL